MYLKKLVACKNPILLEWIDSEKIMGDYQFTLRASKSVIYHTISVKQTQLLGYEYGIPIYVIVTDFQTASDTMKYSFIGFWRISIPSKLIIQNEIKTKLNFQTVSKRTLCQREYCEQAE